MGAYLRRAAPYIIVLAFSLYIPCFALTTELTASLDSRNIRVQAHLTGINRNEVSTALKEGLKSEIVFQFRLYKKNKGFFSFTGDILVLEKKLSYIAYKDLFKNQFIIQTEYDKLTFDDELLFFEQFIEIDEFLMALTENPAQGEYTALARITINPVKLDPPLHIVSLITPIGTTTEWAEFAIPGMTR